MRAYHFVIAFAVLLLDRVSKHVVAKDISLHDSITQWKIALLVLFSIVALVIVSALLWRSSHTMTASAVGLSLILGGALGNLWDRVLNGRVVDFLLVYIGSYQWPAFNVADSAIVVGAGLLVFEILFTKSPAAEKSA